MRWALGLSDKYLIIPLILIMFFLGSHIAEACKYSIRDVGFVDLDLRPYQLYLFSNWNQDNATADDFLQIATLNFIYANVEAKRVDPVTTPNHSAIKYKNRLEIEELPALELVSPDDRVRQIKTPQNNSSFESIMTSVITSPARKQILNWLSEVYSIVLVVEGRDKKVNQRAIEIAKGSIADIKQSMDRLPKSAGDPPRCVHITYEQRQNESILLWSLGLDKPTENDAYILLVFGRSRKIGQTFTVPGATQMQVTSVLNLVGQDCECGVDRSYMQGTMIPHEWTPKNQSLAVKKLGFDPGSPLVMAEMQRILAKGGTAIQSEFRQGNLESSGSGSSELGLFDYIEIELTEEVPVDITSTTTKAQIDKKTIGITASADSINSTQVNQADIAKDQQLQRTDLATNLSKSKSEVQGSTRHSKESSTQSSTSETDQDQSMSLPQAISSSIKASKSRIVTNNQVINSDETVIDNRLPLPLQEERSEAILPQSSIGKIETVESAEASFSTSRYLIVTISVVAILALAGGGFIALKLRRLD